MSVQSKYCSSCGISIVPDDGACPECGMYFASLLAPVPDTGGSASQLIPWTGKNEGALVREAGEYQRFRSERISHVVLILDKSASMRVHEKSRQMDEGARECVQELIGAGEDGDVKVSLVRFSSEAEVVFRSLAPTEARGCLSPTRTHGNTDIAAPLSEARRILREDVRPKDQATVLLMTDGGHNGKGDPKAESFHLRKIADIVTVAIGPDADERFLRETLASSPDLFWRIRDSGGELTRFLRKFGTTLSQSIRSGQPPTSLMTRNL